jgi:hypothetical protein
MKKYGSFLVLSGLLTLSACGSSLGDVGKMMDDFSETTKDLMGEEGKKEDAKPGQQGQPGEGGGSATCCVNGAFYTCGGVAEASQCVGEPFKLVDCLGACGDSACEQQCISKYGPDPSPCQRDATQDNTCQK